MVNLPTILVQSQCAACLNILRAVRLHYHHPLPLTPDLPRSLALFINMLQYTQLTPAAAPNSISPILLIIYPSFIRCAIFPLINYRLAPRWSFCLFAFFLFLIGDMLISVFFCGNLSRFSKLLPQGNFPRFVGLQILSINAIHFTFVLVFLLVWDLHVRIPIRFL